YDKYHAKLEGEEEEEEEEEQHKTAAEDELSSPNRESAWYTTKLPANTKEQLTTERVSPSKHSTATVAVFKKSDSRLTKTTLRKEHACWKKDDPIVKVRANDHRIFAISEKGHVFVQGQNQHGECGVVHAHTNGFQLVPQKAFVCRPLSRVNHSLFVTETGRLFTCGADNFMQLGLGWTKRRCLELDAHWTDLGKRGFQVTVDAFQKIPEDNKNLELICMKFHFFFFFFFPPNYCCCCCILYSVLYMHTYTYMVPPHDEHVPRVVLGPYFDHYRVLSVACGDYHSAVVVEPITLPNLNRSGSSKPSDVRLKQGRRVITWGSGLKGQLGHSNFTNAVEPHAVSLLRQVKEFSETENTELCFTPLQVACGKEHTLVLMEGHSEDTKYVVYAFGANQYRQLAKKKKVKLPSPYLIDCLSPKVFPIHNVAAGHHQSAEFRLHKKNYLKINVIYGKGKKKCQILAEGAFSLARNYVTTPTILTIQQQYNRKHALRCEPYSMTKKKKKVNYFFLRRSLVWILFIFLIFFLKLESDEKKNKPYPTTIEEN
ncbi:hypothetical protein RFI_20626, partial [Reticulomyxa filosa]